MDNYRLVYDVYNEEEKSSGPHEKFFVNEPACLKWLINQHGHPFLSIRVVERGEVCDQDNLF